MINPGAIFKLKGLWERFTGNHPKLPMFIRAAAGSNLTAGTIIDIHIVTADGKELATNVKLTEDDMELVQELKESVR